MNTEAQNQFADRILCLVEHGLTLQQVAWVLSVPEDMIREMYIDSQDYVNMGEEDYALTKAEDGFMSDAEADADVLRGAGMGTDEDYGHYPHDEDW